MDKRVYLHGCDGHGVLSVLNQRLEACGLVERDDLKDGAVASKNFIEDFDGDRVHHVLDGDEDNSKVRVLLRAVSGGRERGGGVYGGGVGDADFGAGGGSEAEGMAT
jgi:hypothetical protein